MLAAVQELDKLSLLATDGKIDLELVTGAVADNARYNLFAVVDTALAERASEAVRMLEGLQGEGTAPQVVLWALHRELSTLQRCREAIDSGQRPAAAVQANKVWKNRQRLVTAALKRLSQQDLCRLLELAVVADHTSKGMRDGDPWQALTDVVLAMSGVELTIGVRTKGVRPQGV